MSPTTQYFDGRMSIAEQKYRKKEQAILAAAEQLFLERGYGATTMDSIAQAAQVTKQTVYRYFASKKLLFITLIQQDRRDTETFCFGTGAIRQELQRYGEAFVTFHMAPKRLGLYRIMLGESKAHPEIAEVFHQEAQPMWQPVLVQFLQERMAYTEKAEQYGQMLNALLLHNRSAILMGFREIPGRESIRRQVQLATELFLDGALKIPG